MSPTLFRYIFKDLLRVFFLASGALGGIMSFGGLLRPLTQHGLDASQVAQMLTWLTFPMMAYSLPVAALFATTVVYGRLSADNELVACRAGGISHLAMAMPAMLLGLVVSGLSLLLLLFISPACTLKVEQVVSSNIAKLIANQVERSHRVRLQSVTVFAQHAWLPDPAGLAPGEQQVVLESPTIVTYAPPPKTDRRYLVPEDFHLATRATLQISQSPGDEQVQLWVLLENGTKFPREFAGAQQGGVGTARVGPILIDSPIKENTKFLPINRLHELRGDNQKSRKIQALLASLKQRDQMYAYLWFVRDDLNDDGVAILAGDRRYVFQRLGAECPPAVERQGELVLTSSPDENDPARRVRFRIERNPQPGAPAAPQGAAPEDAVTIDAREVEVKVTPLPAQHLLDLEIELRDVKVTEQDGTVGYHRSRFYPLRVPMPPSVREIENRDARYYLSAPARWQQEVDAVRNALTQTQRAPTTGAAAQADDAARRLQEAAKDLAVKAERHDAKVQKRALRVAELAAKVQDTPPESRAGELGELGQAVELLVNAASTGDQRRLNRELAVLRNDVESEIHGRLSFALSCLVLVMVGCALGMMFRSGNFLSAFAVSFIPAMVSITLIVAGQRVCGSVPLDYPDHPNPVKLGLTLAWAGNAINVALAVGLLWRLQRK